MASSILLKNNPRGAEPARQRRFPGPLPERSPAPHPGQRQRGHPRSLRGQRCPARPGPAGSPPEAAGAGRPLRSARRGGRGGAEAGERPRPRRGEAAAKGELPAAGNGLPPPSSAPSLRVFVVLRHRPAGASLRAAAADSSLPPRRRETPASTLRVRGGCGGVLAATRREPCFPSQKEEGKGGHNKGKRRGTTVSAHGVPRRR